MNKVLKSEVLISVLLLAFLLLFTIIATGYKPEARLFPFLAGGIGLMAGAADLIKILHEKAPSKKEEKNADLSWPERNRFWIVLVGIVLFIIGIFIMGFTISALIYLFVTMWLLGVKKPLTLILVTVLIVAVVYFAFGYGLGVPIPPGLLFE